MYIVIKCTLLSNNNLQISLSKMLIAVSSSTAAPVPGLGQLIFHTTEPLFPLYKVAKHLNSFVHHSPLPWPPEGIEAIRAISSTMLLTLTNYVCNQTMLA